jgi:hypothetical protein
MPKSSHPILSELPRWPRDCPECRSPALRDLLLGQLHEWRGPERLRVDIAVRSEPGWLCLACGFDW